MIWTRAFLAVALIFTPLAAYGQAAQPVVPVVGGLAVSSTNPLPVTGSGGAAVAANITGWANGTLGSMANFGSSPGAVLVPGANVDTPTSSNLYGALTAAVPCLNATAYNTNTYTTGATSPANCDLHSNVYVNLAPNSQLASLVSGLLTPPIQVINGASTLNTVAASQTKQALTGGGGGAAGDYLSFCMLVPATTSPGEVDLYDSSGGAKIILFAGGASSVSNLVPFSLAIGAVSTAGAWEITTNTNESLLCTGKFH